MALIFKSTQEVILELVDFPQMTSEDYEDSSPRHYDFKCIVLFMGNAVVICSLCIECEYHKVLNTV